MSIYNMLDLIYLNSQYLSSLGADGIATEATLSQISNTLGYVAAGGPGVDNSIWAHVVALSTALADQKDTLGDRGTGMSIYNMLDLIYLNSQYADGIATEATLASILARLHDPDVPPGDQEKTPFTLLADILAKLTLIFDALIINDVPPQSIATMIEGVYQQLGGHPLHGMLSTENVAWRLRELVNTLGDRDESSLHMSVLELIESIKETLGDDLRAEIDIAATALLRIENAIGSEPNSDEPRPLAHLLTDALNAIEEMPPSLTAINNALGSEPNSDEPRPLAHLLTDALNAIEEMPPSLTAINNALGSEPNSDEPRAIAHLLTDALNALEALPGQICECMPDAMGSDSSPLDPPDASEGEGGSEKSNTELCAIAHKLNHYLWQKSWALAKDNGWGDNTNNSSIASLAEILNIQQPSLLLSPTDLLFVLGELHGLGDDCEYLGDLDDGDFSTYQEFICGVATSDSPATALSRARAAMEFANYYISGTMTPRPQQVRFVRIYTTLLSPSLVNQVWKNTVDEYTEIEVGGGGGSVRNLVPNGYNCFPCFNPSDDPSDPYEPEPEGNCSGSDYGSTSGGVLYFPAKNQVRWYQRAVSFIKFDNYGFAGVARHSGSWGISPLGGGMEIAAEQAGVIHVRLVASESDVRVGVDQHDYANFPRNKIRLNHGDYESCHSINAEAGKILWAWNDDERPFTIELTMGGGPPPASGCESGTVYNSVLSTIWGYSKFSGWSTSQRHAISWDGGESRVEGKFGISPQGGLVINQHSVAYVQLLADNGYDVQAHYGPLTVLAPQYTKLVKNDYTTCYEIELQVDDRFYIRAGGAFSVKVNIQPY